jgi:hypothetical protein
MPVEVIDGQQLHRDEAGGSARALPGVEREGQRQGRRKKDNPGNQPAHAHDTIEDRAGPGDRVPRLEVLGHSTRAASAGRSAL